METLRIHTDQTGVTAIEYALMAALIAVACLVSLVAMGGAVTNLYTAWVEPALAAL